jgi:hypothetical protein
MPHYKTVVEGSKRDRDAAFQFFVEKNRIAGAPWLASGWAADK